VFNIANYSSTKSIFDFEKTQTQSISSARNMMSQIWVKDIAEILTSHLPTLFTVTAKEKNKSQYANSLLKKFFFLIKLHMEETLEGVVRKSVKRFFNYIRLAHPDYTNCISGTEVVNVFKRFEGCEPGTYVTPEPLFSIEVVADPEHHEFKYNMDLPTFARKMVEVFESGVRALQSVESVERKMMRDYFRTDPIV
jgi:hypothetical protein